MGEYNTLFGRLPTRPSVQAVDTPILITGVQTGFNELWIALETFAAAKTWDNLIAMKNKAAGAKSAADAVGDQYDGTELESPADALKNAADDALDNLTIWSSAAYIAGIQQNIVDAANNFAATLPLVLPQAPGMNASWPASCTLFASPQWRHWQNLVFYQVAEGFKPGGAASCGNCMSVEGSGHSAAGSGSYHAVVIAAGKKLTASRNYGNIGDYLEADNLLPGDNSVNPYKTYRMTDAEYQTANDLVLCLDGKVNCK
jgi:hypothetical protein